MNQMLREYIKIEKKILTAMLRFGYFLNIAACFLLFNQTFADQTTSNTLQPFQRELIETAFKTASKIPVEPHIKDRSKAQEVVVETCLKLQQPDLALQYIDAIENWRRGSCYADVALYFSKKGENESVKKYLEIAETIANDTEDWRRDHIRVKIAQAYVLLGRNQEAENFRADVVDAEVGKVDATQASLSDNESFDEQIRSLDALIKQDSFDVLKNALGAYAELYKRFYDDLDKRALIEEKIKSTWTQLPIFIRIELLFQLADIALESQDRQQALAKINEAQSFINQYQWKLEHRLPLSSQLIELRYKAGEKEQARSDATAALRFFIKDKQNIVNIWRAGALRPLAQAFNTIQDATASLSVYKLAIDEGTENPNSRPRAEELSATCCSMALNSVEPDEELWSRINQIFKELNQPW